MYQDWKETNERDWFDFVLIVTVFLSRYTEQYTGFYVNALESRGRNMSRIAAVKRNYEFVCDYHVCALM